MLEELKELASKIRPLDDHECSLMLYYIVGCYEYHAEVADKYSANKDLDFYKDEPIIAKSFISALSDALKSREEIRALK